MQALTRPVEELFDHTGPGLYRLALAITRSPAVAEDVVQEAFARSLVKLSTVENPEAYLYSATRNLALRHLRGVRSEQRAQGKLSAKAWLVAPPGDRLDREEEAQRINDCLDRLPTEQRELIVLRIYNDLSFPLIAETLGVPLGTAHSRFRLAMQRLRSSLGPLK